MIFNNWNISGCVKLRMLDNKTSIFNVSGDIPEGWSWQLLYSCNGNLNIVEMQHEENILLVIFTKEMLPTDGTYLFQLKATKDDLVKHTNIVKTYVNKSLSGDINWPVIPTEFTQIEQAVKGYAESAKESAIKAENAAVHSPIVGENGNWFVWDFTRSEYVDSGKPASTPPITPDTAGKYLTNNGSKAKWGAKVVENIERFDTNELLHVASSYVTAIIKEEGNANSGEMVFPVIAQLDGIIENGSGFMSYLDAHGDHYVGGFSLNGGAVGVPKLTFSNTILYVTITQDGQNSAGNPIYKSDKTYEEIKAAHEAGREVKIARAGVFKDETLSVLGINDFPLDFIDEYSANFTAVGVPAIQFIPSAIVGGQILSAVSIFIYKDGRVQVNFPFDIFDGEITWHERLCYKLPQQYIVTVTAGTDGTLSANNTLAQLNSVAQAYSFVTDIDGESSINAVYNGKLYYMSSKTPTSMTFTATTENGLETLTVSNDGKEGSADVWTHEVAPLGVGTDLSLGITGATVGQIAKITAVDTNGKPTAWEAVDMPTGETWEKIADVALTADTSVYELANFGIYRKIKVTMSRSAYVSGLNKNVLFRIRTANMSGNYYAAIYMTYEYGYVAWEITGEIGKTFTWVQKKTSNNAISPSSVIETVDILSPANPSEYGFYIDFVDTSVIQDGDTVAVYGVKRHGG